MAVFGKSLAGAGYVVLNVIRALNITALLAVVASSSILLVKAFNTNSFFFFDACENVIRVVICGFLILTELPLFKPYFLRNWPLFSPASGFVMLGAAMLLVGNGVLANLNKATASQARLGLAFWRLVISSGIVIIVMGAVNIFSSYIFRDTTLNLTARQVRSNGAVASHKLDVASSIAASSPKQSRRSKYKSFFLLNGKRDSLPSYHAKTYMTQTPVMQDQTPHVRMPSPTNPEFQRGHMASPSNASSKYSEHISSPIQRPNLAHHPAMTSGYTS